MTCWASRLNDRGPYLRQFDGDYQMSASEEQMLLLRHHRPTADAQTVHGSSRRDLDEELVNRYLASVRETTLRLVNDSDESVFYFTGVVADRETGELSVAGLYALGEYPQRLLPYLTVTAAVEGSEGSRGKGIDLRITSDGFRLTNPGGLWGITVDRLGSGGHPAVNERLYQICRNVHGSSGSVIEAMGTGIREACYLDEAALLGAL